jgi:hypothetical protein
MHSCNLLGRYGVKLLQQEHEEASRFKAAAERIEQQLTEQNRMLSQLCLRHPNLPGLAKLSAGDFYATDGVLAVCFNCQVPHDMLLLHRLRLRCNVGESQQP